NKMKQLTFVKSKKLVWEETTEPVLEKEDDALVRPFIVARCDLDAVFLFREIYKLVNLGKWFGQVDPAIDKLIRPNIFKGAFPFGHECIAEIVALGKAVQNFSIGQKVIIPFQLSCGTCPICAAGLTSQCEVTGSFNMYSGIGKHISNGGTMSDILKVPYANKMLIPIPEGMSWEGLGSASDNLPDAWSRVAPFLLKKPKQKVLILGGTAQSVGLYATAFAVKMKTALVDYVDTSAERVAIAKKLGANGIQKNFRQHQGNYDLIVSASGSTKAIDYAIQNLNPGGVLTSAMIYLNKKINVPFFKMYAKNLTIKTGLANPMADIPQMLNFIQEEDIQPELVTTHVGNWDNADKELLKKTPKVMIKRNPIK
ncbi:MAG: alcohol dehydrogenase catalytic domain-containing protein, partial [Bacteroidota bacterium]